VSGTTYKVSLVIYGDCSGAIFPTLDGATPTVFLLNNGFGYSSFNLVQDGPGVEVTPVCAAQQNYTTCKTPPGTVPGVTRYIYSLAVNVPYLSTNWLFRFAGTMGNSSQAGRSNSITNVVVGASGSVMTLEAALNNTLGPNSSPQFTTIPTPFYCVNIAQQYNQGAVDIDNDSLDYALAAGLQGSGTVTYNPGYSATTPLATTASGFSFSNTTGQMAFTPNTVQQSLVVNQVIEYRNGVIVGTASREMTFIVLNNCNTSPASSEINRDSTSGNYGGVATTASTFELCRGTDSIHFSIRPVNPGNDTIIASVNGLPVGATAAILQNNTKNPIIHFNWKTANLPIGSTHTFYVTYKDNGCPLTSQKTQAYVVQVIHDNEMTYSILYPTECAHKAYVQYNFTHGLMPRKVTIKQGNTVVQTFIDNTGSYKDSLAQGAYTVTISSLNLLCESQYNIQINDSGVYPNKPIPAYAYYCKWDPPMLLNAAADPGATLTWYTASGSTLGGPPMPRTDTTGIFYWLIDQQYKVCRSRKDTIKVYVTQRPVASFVSPPSICMDDTATVLFNGRIGVGPILEYFWNWGGAGYANGTGPGPWRVHWYSPGVKIIKLTVAENKCSSFEVEDTILIKPVPYAGFDIDPSVCRYDTVRATYNTQPLSIQRFLWDFDGADPLNGTGRGPYILRWNTSGTKTITLAVDIDGCTDTQRHEVVVNPIPDVKILNKPEAVCIGDKIFLEATGGVKYEWSPEDSMLHTPEGRLYVQILKPSVYAVTVTNEFNCIDSASINYAIVEPCCNFAYPNAFTPNADGRNDKFRVITYGNQREFELSIYNRWGQRVYYGIDSKQGWDGTYGGKPCDAGTYFYYVNALCFTGHQETTKGTVILVR
jgi:gliding motility-associated-like protein